jgi:hypothetical protein
MIFPLQRLRLETRTAFHHKGRPVIMSTKGEIPGTASGMHTVLAVIRSSTT